MTGHECTPSLTAGEEREAAALLKRAISTSPDKGIIHCLQKEQLSLFSITYLVMSYLTIPNSDDIHATKANRPQLLASGL